MIRDKKEEKRKKDDAKLMEYRVYKKLWKTGERKREEERSATKREKKERKRTENETKRQNEKQENKEIGGSSNKANES